MQPAADNMEKTLFPEYSLGISRKKRIHTTTIQNNIVIASVDTLLHSDENVFAV